MKINKITVGCDHAAFELKKKVIAHLIERGIEVAKKLDNAKEQSVWTDRYRDIVNFKYWRHRAAFEQLPDVIQARKLLYEGKKAFREGDLTVSKRDFDQAFALIKKSKESSISSVVYFRFKILNSRCTTLISSLGISSG